MNRYDVRTPARYAATDTRPTWEAKSATPGQFQLISDMAKERGIDVASVFRRPASMQEASTIITWLKAQPKQAVAPSSPSQPSAPQLAKGYYALRGDDGVVRFYRVKPRRNGGYFLDVQASDELHPVRNYGVRTMVIAKIQEDPKAVMALYGQELGRCGRCHRTLTDETSRALGIGPECRKK